MDAQNLMVVKTQPGGLASEYNQSTSSGQAIRMGDRIWKVNGQTGTADELLTMLAAESRLQLEIHRCQEKEFHIEKKGKSLGLQLAVTEKACCLTVEKISAAGVVAALNEHAAPDRQIRVHDKIISVDGVRGLAAWQRIDSESPCVRKITMSAMCFSNPRHLS
ncbi:unnamed protein product [Durusdinium trenchii]|uniref:PDZ domain-containing protein n=1 Tax=Durusdinium trenchii TaxID=1381693 RepID=A0ABP0RGE9_9DINO